MFGQKQISFVREWEKSQIASHTTTPLAYHLSKSNYLEMAGEPSRKRSYLSCNAEPAIVTDLVLSGLWVSFLDTEVTHSAIEDRWTKWVVEFTGREWKQGFLKESLSCWQLPQDMGDVLWDIADAVPGRLWLSTGNMRGMKEWCTKQVLLNLFSSLNKTNTKSKCREKHKSCNNYRPE